MLDRLASTAYRVTGKLEDVFVAVVAWLSGEQVIVHYLGALAVTVLARWGVHLSPAATAEVLAVSGAVAAWAARRKVFKRASVVAHGEASYAAGRSKQARPKIT